MTLKDLLIPALALAFLAGLFLWLQPQAPAEPASPLAPAAVAPAAASVAAPAPAVAPTPMVYAWTVREGQRIDGPAVVSLREGDTVELRVLSDREDELHAHGYELHAHLEPGKPATMRFVAEHSGRYTIELHRSGIELTSLEVQPR